MTHNLSDENTPSTASPSPPKILLIRFSSIGDIVLTSPVIRVLQQQLGAELHFLTKESYRSVLLANPYLTKIWTIKRKVSEVTAALRQVGFSAIIDLHHNLRSQQVRWALWPSKYYAFDKLNWAKWLLTNWKINRLPAVHIVDRYLAAAQPLGVHNDQQGLDYFIPAGSHVNLSQWLPANNSVPFIALVIGAAHATKRLPEAKLIALARSLSQPVLLLGGPDEVAVGARIAAAAGPQVVNTCGQLKLNESASVVQQAALVITHDTGLMHVAAAFRKPIIAIWGNTVPAFGMYPYFPAGTDNYESVEVNDLPCRPCSKIGYNQCPQGHFRCMLDIDLPLVLEKINRLR